MVLRAKPTVASQCCKLNVVKRNDDQESERSDWK